MFNFRDILSLIKKELYYYFVAIFISSILISIWYTFFTLKYFALIQSNINNFFIDNFEFRTFFSYEIIRYFIFFISSYLITNFFHSVSIWIIGLVMPNINQKMKKIAFDKVLSMNYQVHESNNAGDIEKYVTNFSNAFCLILEDFTIICARFVELISCLFICYKIFHLFIGAILWIFVMAIIIYFRVKQIIKISEKRSIAQNNQSGFISEIIENITLLKIYKCHDYINKRYMINQNEENKHQRNFAVSWGFGRLFFTIICDVFLLINLVLIVTHKSYYQPSFFLVQIWAIVLIFHAAMSIAWRYLSLQGQFNSSWNFLKENSLSTDKTTQISKINHIIVENLNLEFRNEMIFDNLSLDLIMNNKFYGIKGQSGRGKTTLIKIIMGLLEKKSGQVRINSIEVSNIKNILEKVSYLPQKDRILNDTVENNICLGKNYDQKKLKEILSVLELENYDLQKICGVNGSLISGGEGKRICLARTLLFDDQSKIMILDEPFNNLSQQIVTNILAYMSKFKGNRNLIVIDHTGYFAELVDDYIAL